MSRATHFLCGLARFRAGRPRSIFLSALVVLGVAVGPSVAAAAELTLDWVDNANGQAAFVIERGPSVAGPYAPLAQSPPGVTSYTDSTVLLGTTYCYRVAAFNEFGMSDYSNPACGRPSGEFTVTVTKAGNGVGTVGSSPAGIDCGTACSYTYPAGTWVTLTATTSSGSVFSGWSGGGCGGTDPCTMAGEGLVTVTATFVALETYTLTVVKEGSGTVKSSPGKIRCGSICKAVYATGTVVTLTAIPRRYTQFDGWSGGGCTGTGTCTVTLNGPITVTASFSKTR